MDATKNEPKGGYCVDGGRERILEMPGVLDSWQQESINVREEGANPPVDVNAKQKSCRSTCYFHFMIVNISLQSGESGLQ